MILSKHNYFRKLQKMIRNWTVEAKEEETDQVPKYDLLYGITQVREFMECLPGAKSLLAEWRNCWVERSIITIQR